MLDYHYFEASIKLVSFSLEYFSTSVKLLGESLAEKIHPVVTERIEFQKEHDSKLKAFF